MRRGGRILVLLGVVLGLVTALGTFVVLGSSQQAGPAIPTKSVVVAQQNIGNLAEISVEALGKADWPEASLPPGVFERVDEVAGRIALQPIYPGQIILPQMIVSKDKAKESRTYASLIVPDGKVAVSFQITPLSGVAGAIQPGDSVDILLTLAPPPPVTQTTTVKAPTAFTGTEGQPVTQLFLQDVPVIQVGTWSTGAAADKNAPVQANYLTFILDRQDALALKAAREQGQIELSLRRAGDHKPVTTEPVTLQYINKRFNFNLVPAIR